MLRRRFDGKTIGTLFVMILTVCLSAFASLRSADAWTLNPSDFRYDMSLYFGFASEKYADLEAYEVAAFIDDECRGLAEKIELPDGGSYLFMRIRSNSTEQQEITLMAREKNTGKIITFRGADGKSLLFKSDDVVGLPSEPYVLDAYFNVTVEAGENGSVKFENGSYAEGSVIKLEAVPAEGYSFEGWSDGDKEADRTLTVTDNLDLTATFVVNTYTVVFKIGDDVIAQHNVAYGEKIAAPEVAEKEGYTFAGWTDLPETMPAKDLEISGSYTINSYKLTFKVGDEVIEEKEVAYGAEISLPAAPEKEGYTFNGWDQALTTMPAKDVEITGSYTANLYIVSFYLDGKAIESMQVAYGAEISVPKVEEKEGYTFSGWGDVPATMPAKNLDFNGTYTVNSYKLTFAIGDEVIEEKTVEYGAEITAPAVPDKEGHKFQGWLNMAETMPAYDLTILGTYEKNTHLLSFMIDDQPFEEKVMYYGDEIVAPEVPEKEGYTFSGWGDLPATMPAKDLTINATYTVNSYKLTFAIGDEMIEEKAVEYGAEITAPEAPEKTGYTFAGWGEMPETMPAKDLTINGTYTVNSYKLTFTIGDEMIEEKTVEYGAEITAPEAPEKEGYTFGGWGELPATMPAEDLSITAAYNVNFYQLTFVIDEEVIEVETVAYGSEIKTPATPDKEGHKFAGWINLVETMPASDLTVYGSYEANTHLVTFMIGDEVLEEKVVKYGSEIPLPEVPEKEGYTFSGWGDVPATMPAKDLVFTGYYNIDYFTITFMADGKEVETQQLAYGSEVVAPEAPEKEGYTFEGWGDVPATMPAQTLVFQAGYTVNYYKLTVYIDNEVYMEESVAYGEEIVIPEPVAPENMKFEGWNEEIPATMPAHDVTITGNMVEDEQTSVAGILFDADEAVSVYNLSGQLLFKDVKASELNNRLVPGLYIINGKKVMVK